MLKPVPAAIAALAAISPGPARTIDDTGRNGISLSGMAVCRLSLVAKAIN